MSQDPADHNPYASPESPETFSRPKQSSFALNAVALLNYAIGTTSLMCGGCLAGFSIPESSPPIPGPVFVVLVIGLGLIFLSLPALLAGYGIQRRKQWGRVLSIILGVLSGVLAVSHFLWLNPKAISVIYGGYTVFVLFILLRPKYAAEFRALSPSEGE